MTVKADRAGTAPLGLSPLTPRQLQLAALVAKGWSNRQIAQELNLTEGSVRVFLHRIYRKLDLVNRTELALLILKNRT
jgi:two-component system nitrate/nitrite response regulator NarL